MVSRWVVLASVVMLALAAPEVEEEEEDPERMLLLMKCCHMDKVVKLDLKHAETCSKSAGLGDKDSQPSEEKECEMHECMLEKNELLKEDKSIKEDEFKQIFLDKADPDAKPVVQAALDKCFDEFKKNPKKAKGGSCKSGVNFLIGCFSKDVHVNCPDKMWDKTSLKCQAARGKGDEEQERMWLLTQCCDADRVVSLDFKEADTCSKSAGLDDKDSPPTDEKVCNMHECIFEKNGVLKEDKSIKEEEFKKLFLDKADPDTEPVVQAALDKCFDEFKKKPDHGTCKSGVNLLVSCFVKEVYTNCPDKLWDKNSQKCQAVQGDDEEQKRMSLLTECCLANKVVRLKFKKGGKSCSKSAGLDDKNSPPTYEKVCKAQECILRKNGLLNKNKSIKENEFRKRFVKKADHYVKPVLKVALSRCFGQLKDDHKAKSDSCKSGVNSLLGCLTKEVYTNCPKKIWNKKNPKCKDAIKEL